MAAIARLESVRHFSASLGQCSGEDGHWRKVTARPISKRGQGLSASVPACQRRDVGAVRNRAQEDPGWSNCSRPRSARSPPALLANKWRAIGWAVMIASGGLPLPSARSSWPRLASLAPFLTAVKNAIASSPAAVAFVPVLDRACARRHPNSVRDGKAL